MSSPKVLAFAGSTRKESVNKRLARIALQAAKKAGAETTFVDLQDFNIPLYCDDLVATEGIPEGVLQFKQLLNSHNGFFYRKP